MSCGPFFSELVTPSWPRPLLRLHLLSRRTLLSDQISERLAQNSFLCLWEEGKSKDNMFKSYRWRNNLKWERGQAEIMVDCIIDYYLWLSFCLSFLSQILPVLVALYMFSMGKAEPRPYSSTLERAGMSWVVVTSTFTQLGLEQDVHIHIYKLWPVSTYIY